MNRAADWLLVCITMGVLAAVMGVCGYWLFFDTAPPSVHTFVDTADDKGNATKLFYRGERMVIVRDSCVNSEGMVFYTRVFTNLRSNLIYFMPSGWVFLKKGCRRAFNQVDIPTYIEPGNYKYIVTITHQNNPLMESSYDLPAPEVTIK